MTDQGQLEEDEKQENQVPVMLVVVAMKKKNLVAVEVVKSLNQMGVKALKS